MKGYHEMMKCRARATASRTQKSILGTSQERKVPKYPLPTMPIQNVRQLAGEKILKHHTKTATSIAIHLRKLDTLVADFPDTYTLIGQDEVSKTYSFPKTYVSYHKPRKLSGQQRERARQMMIERNREKVD